MKLTPDQRRKVYKVEKAFVNRRDLNIETIFSLMKLPLDPKLRGSRDVKFRIWPALEKRLMRNDYGGRLTYIVDSKFVGRPGVWTIDPTDYVIAREMLSMFRGHLTRARNLLAITKRRHLDGVEGVSDKVAILDIYVRQMRLHVRAIALADPPLDDECLLRIRDKVEAGLL